jgi:hypothetical protein
MGYSQKMKRLPCGDDYGRCEREQMRVEAPNVTFLQHMPALTANLDCPRLAFIMQESTARSNFRISMRPSLDSRAMAALP